MKVSDRGEHHRLRDQGTEGFANHTLLALIHTEDGHGFGLIRRLHEAGLPTGEGSIHPRLHRMENDGLLDSYKVRYPDNRVRKYYRITTEGRKLLARWNREWRSLRRVMDSLVDGPEQGGNERACYCRRGSTDT